MTDIKCIAIDVDGTLLDSRGRLSARNAEAVRAAAARGVQVLLATGRARAGKCLAILDELALDTPGVFLQGLIVYDGQGNILRAQGLEPEAVARVLQVVHQHAFPTVAYCGAAAYAAERNYYTESPLRGDECDLLLTPALSDLDPATVNKIVVFDEPASIPHARRTLASALDGTVFLTSSSHDSVEVLPLGVSKGRSLAWLLPRLGVTPAELMTLGDGENDRELIAMAGLGVAMGNAHPAAREAARFVTATNDEDGVALAIERLVLA